MADTNIAAGNRRSATDHSLRHALLDSRQRWRDLVLTSADIVYETDAAGHLVFVMPDPVLGWSTSTLLDYPADRLLISGISSDTFNPFRVTAPVRRRRCWLQRADGSAVMLAFAAAPLVDSEGRIVGTRGMGVDWSEFDGAAARNAAALRRGEVLDHILWRMGHEVMAPRMMQAALDALINALGAEGAAVIDVQGDASGRLMHVAGRGAEEVLPAAARLLASTADLVADAGSDGRPILAATCRSRFGSNGGIALWRSPGSRGWDGDDRLLVESAASLIRMVLEHETIQKEMAHQARTDPLTGLLNRRAFLEEINRHLDRLEREGLPGTLLYADLDNFKPVNDRLGHEMGDAVLVRAAQVLRSAVRPSDLVARQGGDEFALWMDGADHMTAAERADALCAAMPEALREIVGGDPPTVSIGIVTREAGSDEPLDELLRRADQAMYLVKHSGGGHWRVNSQDPL
ncbi:MAG TPA: sensor domain-containing diguanylate cyclase [Acetobacteraceae bacterium]|nr:sensor domain-containing diguanylate cyclase [Acetobacteraceae bacterium]